MIKDEVGSVDSFGREAQELATLVFCEQILRGRRARFEAEGVEVGVSGFSKEKILFTGTEETTGWVRSGRGRGEKGMNGG